MNSLVSKVIRNNVFRKNIEGEIMYNYKFNDDVTKSLIASCDDSIEPDINALVSTINKINKRLYFDNSVYLDFMDRYNRNKSAEKLHKSTDSRSIIIKDFDAFEELDIKSFKELGDKYSELLNVEEFELKLLEKKKKQLLSDLDIIECIKISKMLSEVKDKISRATLEIDNCNKDIVIKENMYLDKFKDFLEELKLNKNIETKYFIEKFGEKFIKNYKRYQVHNLLQRQCKHFGKEAIKYLFNNDIFKKALADDYDYFYVRFSDNDVGTDSKPGS